jgi:hypothetical protein
VAAVCAGIAGGVVLVADRGPAAGDVAPHDLVVTEVLTAPMVDPDGSCSPSPSATTVPKPSS